ncbi:MAG TPA: hypothetical protein VFA99_01665 [Acidobacteriaceae bacterium]|nr:hypothetical protein [Acidobacteriaceae bacterium]
MNQPVDDLREMLLVVTRSLVTVDDARWQKLAQSCAAAAGGRCSILTGVLAT